MSSLQNKTYEWKLPDINADAKLKAYVKHFFTEQIKVLNTEGKTLPTKPEYDKIMLFKNNPFNFSKLALSKMSICTLENIN